MTATNTATIETLTADVRVLKVGNRQVTLSVYRQLDWIDPEAIEPFGRVHSGHFNGFTHHEGVEVVGRIAPGHAGEGSLARAKVLRKIFRDERGNKHVLAEEPLFDAWSALPLIVLAGLR